MQHRYFLLVVLTAGCGEDLEEFGEALRAAGADLALSVAVIGIGNADFSPLEVRAHHKGLFLALLSPCAATKGVSGVRRES